MRSNRKLRDLRKLRSKVLESAGEDEQIRAAESILDNLGASESWHEWGCIRIFSSFTFRVDTCL